MGLKADAVGENDNLAALGIDSMQLMEVRAVMQKKLCRPIPLEMIGSLTVATLRELAAEAGSKGGRSSARPAEEVLPQVAWLTSPDALSPNACCLPPRRATTRTCLLQPAVVCFGHNLSSNAFCGRLSNGSKSAQWT